MKRTPQAKGGPFSTTTELSGETLRTLRDFVAAIDPSLTNHYFGPKWDIFIEGLLKDGRFSEFDSYSVAHFLYTYLSLESIKSDCDSSQDVDDLIYKHISETPNTHPRQYEYVLEMRGLPTYAGYKIEFSPKISIFTAEAGLLPHETGKKGTGAYLSIKVRGFVPQIGKGSMLEAVEANLKQLAYFLVHDTRLQIGYSDDFPYSAYFETDGRVRLTIPPDGLLIRLLSGLSVTEDMLKPARTGLLSVPWGDTPAEKSAEMAKGWERAQQFFSLPEEDMKSQLGAAMEWYMDSFLDFNETVSYLKACIGIEAILGDREGLTELSKRLEDRYAFMTGRNREERKRLQDAMSAVLNARGKLVHARQRRLGKHERDLLGQAQTILKRCIDHELGTILPQMPAPPMGLRLGAG